MHKKAIVILEGSVPIAEMIKETLSAEDAYQALALADGQEALKVIRAIKTDLVLVDLQLAETDPLQLYDELQNDPCTQSIPVLFVSANDDHPGLKQRGLSQQIIHKPLVLDDLLVRVATALDDHQT